MLYPTELPDPLVFASWILRCKPNENTLNTRVVIAILLIWGQVWERLRPSLEQWE